jgi:DNA primase
MFYPDEVVEEVRERNDIVDVISSYVKLQKKGANYFGLCPFHNEKTPSFSVSPQKQMYYCFGCGNGGNVISFVMQYENITFPEAVRMLASRINMTLPAQEFSGEERKEHDLKETLLEINRLAANHFYRLLYSAEGQHAHEYLTNRKLSEETIRHFGLGFSSKTPGELYRYLKGKGYADAVLKESGLVTIEEKGARDKFWNRVMYPILDANNRVIAFGGRVMGDGEPKYLNSPETKLFDKSRNLYGLNYARSARKDYFLLCEGYMDVIALQQAGFINSVASLGTSLTPGHCLLLKRYVKKVILTYDSDGAGVKAAERAIPLLKEAGISAQVLDMRPYKDPDEFIKALGREAYQKRIDEAKNAFLWEVDVAKRSFDFSDPEQKTQFYLDTAKRLCTFSEPLERENYLQAVSREQMIPADDLRKLVNSTGEKLLSGKIRPVYAEKREPVTGRIKAEKEDGVLKCQRLLLTWLTEDPGLFERTADYIGPDDFTDPLYHEIAVKVYRQHAEGNINPAAIMNAYMDDAETEKKAAAVFNTALKEELEPDEKDKAIQDSIRKIRTESLNKQGREATDLPTLQRIIREKAALKTERIQIGSSASKEQGS